MNKYYKIKALRGLILGMEQDIINSIDDTGKISQKEKQDIIDNYYRAIKELINEDMYKKN